jgi:hypothetical protein
MEFTDCRECDYRECRAPGAPIRNQREVFVTETSVGISGLGATCTVDVRPVVVV